MIDPQTEGPQKLKLQLAYRGAILQNVMPLAMRNMAIAQQRDEERFRLVRSGGYDTTQDTPAQAHGTGEEAAEFVFEGVGLADRHQSEFTRS